MSSGRKHLDPTIYFSSFSPNQIYSKKNFLPIFSPKFSIQPISPSNKYTLRGRYGPNGGPSPSPILFIYYLFFWQLNPPFKILASLLSNQPSQPSRTSNYSIQKLNKNNKSLHNGDCILPNKTILLPKNHMLLEKLKLHFL